ncbi:hypothetical protein ACFXKY_32480 [Streptomyces canus]|uniref:hypothetical protein n=1 Tax=Streptomyces canus TaxID=58343 RepID=UPI003699B229
MIDAREWLTAFLLPAYSPVALDRLEALVRNRLKRLPYRPETLDGFIVGTGLAEFGGKVYEDRQLPWPKKALALLGHRIPLSRFPRCAHSDHWLPLTRPEASSVFRGGRHPCEDTTPSGPWQERPDCSRG